METTFDHLHSPAPALAGIASKAAVGTATPQREHGARNATRGFARRAGAGRLALLSVIALATVAAGSASFIANAASGDTRVGNTVRAFGGAPALGPDAPLDLKAGVVDIASDPAADGYWLVSSDGGVFAYGAAPFLGSTGGIPLNAPIVGIAPTPSGLGYWLVATDGGVFAYGDARFHGSLGASQMSSPILSIASTPTGQGYWLVSADGGVFTFGDAKFHGSAANLDLDTAVIGIAPTNTGDGYWLLGTDGGVFAYGDAEFLGSAVDTGSPSIAITSSPTPGVTGYWTLRANGTINGFGVDSLGDLATLTPDAPPAVGIAARASGGYWLAQGAKPPSPAPAAAPADVQAHPFLVCTRAHESSHTPPLYNDGYGAINPSGKYRGAYQFDQGTWNSTARHAGRLDLVNVDPAAAAPADQDQLALDLYNWRGAAPWLGRCAGK
jgi:hypothetical protein